MGVTARAFAGERDLPLIADLLRAVPPTTRHLVDLRWRLASPTLLSGHDARLWLDDKGVLTGVAAWQVWWAALDTFVRPGALQAEIEAAIFAWAPGRFRELDAERGRPLPYWVEAREDDGARLALLERHGYTLDDDYAYVILGRPLIEPIPPSRVPGGYTIRPLAGEAEATPYAALHRRAFTSTSMTVEWRERTLRSPWYQPDLDLVAVAPDGRLAGFCVGWLDSARRIGQIEPLGVDPAFQGRGLGGALLQELFRRFRERGAEQAMVETENSRLPALRAYEAAGFHQEALALRKGQWFSPP